VPRRVAEVGSTSSGSEKRATGAGLVESQVGAQERVDGSLTGGGSSNVQAFGIAGGKRRAVQRGAAILIT